MKNNEISKWLKKLVILIVKIKGRIKVISTSKIKKITAIKKKWRENGKRAGFLGSNPHSKGLLFSRSENVFFLIKFKIITNKLAIKMIIILINKIILIIYTRILDFLIGSQR